MKAVLLLLMFSLQTPDGKVVLASEPFEFHMDTVACNIRRADLEERGVGKKLVQNYENFLLKQFNRPIKVLMFNYNCRDLSNVEIVKDSGT